MAKKKTKNKKVKCFDCGVLPGKPHVDGCDVERCTVCDRQYISFPCKGHDKMKAKWTGEWPAGCYG